MNSHYHRMTIDLPGIAYDEILPTTEHRAEEQPDPWEDAIGVLERAIPRRAGSGYRYQVTASVDTWMLILEELTYRWEINGGNGDPYGVSETGEAWMYRSARRSCETARNRVMRRIAECPQCPAPKGKALTSCR
jgi:hypothetical protein